MTNKKIINPFEIPKGKSIMANEKPPRDPRKPVKWGYFEIWDSKKSQDFRDKTIRNRKTSI